MRKASMAFTSAGSESMYADDNRLHDRKAGSELKPDDVQVERQQSADQDSSTVDNKGPKF